LRFRVYCLETGFEDPGLFDQGEESDAYDLSSLHFLVRCTATGEWLSAARLIIRGDGPLPVEQHCSVDPSRYSPAGAPDGEISRLLLVSDFSAFRAVSASFYQLPAEMAAEAPAARVERIRADMNVRTEVLRRLLVGIFHAAYERGLRELAFFLTPALVRRVFGQFGPGCILIGDPCHHRGVRYPYRVDVQYALDGLRAFGPVLPLPESGEPYRRFTELLAP
jgi:N-acyl amino acid synthase of PEP-CTERM/exosortase system